MGDRGNIKIQGGRCFPHPVWFYGHWAGHRLKQTVAKALDRGRDRWGDDSYLARIIFDELTDGDRSNLSFGIDTSGGGDNERPFVVVDMAKRTVHEEPDKRKGFGYIQLTGDSIKEPISFDDFIQQMKQEQEETETA